VSYTEQPAGVPEVVLWQRAPVDRPTRSRILPDGCLDLLWDGRALLVAGPDPVARWHASPAGTGYLGLRFAAGTGPVALRVPADELTGQVVELADLWPAAAVRRLADRIADDPVAGLKRWSATALGEAEVDPFGARVRALLAGGASVATLADRLGLGARQLHRRSLITFGYGPRRLGRILRLNRALELARAGRPWAGVAADCGYADQAHLSREVRALTGETPTELLD